VLAALAALDAVILVARIAAALHAGGASALSAEGPVLYSIWKLRHGAPLYEDPFAAPFSVTLYNFLFYDAYAAALALFRVADRATPLAARLVTALIALGGAALQYAAVRAVPGSRRIARPVAAIVAALTWFGAVLPGQWSLAIRPDAGAVALDMAGMVLVLQVLRGRHPVRLAAAGALFYLAWAFKQTSVVAAPAAVLYLLTWRRSWRDAALVGVPFAAGIALTLAVGGAVYRTNIIAAPALSALTPLNVWFGVRTIVLPDALFWTAVVCALPRLRPSTAAAGAGARAPYAVDVTYPLLVTLAAAGAAIPMLAKAGSAINHAIELKACAGVVVAAILDAGVSGTATVLRARARTAIVWGAALVMVASNLSRLRVEYPSLSAGAAGRDAAVALRRDAAARISALPTPVYAEDELYALPWIANGNRYPAVVPDAQVYQAARAAGVSSDTVESMVARRAFASLALAATSPLLSVAERSGYERVDVLPQLGAATVVVLRRPAGAGTR
jgi:hypothetical protein